MASVNPWTKFKQLLPQPSRYTVTITAQHDDGTLTGNTRDGSSVRVIGKDVTLGTRVWVQDGRVVGEAPALTSYTEYV